MINKQITMPNDLLTKAVATEETEKKEEEVKDTVEEVSSLTAMRVSLEEERQGMMDDLQEQLTSDTISSEEKNNAYEQLKYLNSLQSKEEEFEKKIKKELDLDSFVKIDNTDVSVVCVSSKHDSSLANSVINIIGEGSSKYSDVVNKITSDKSSKVNPDYIFKKLINLEIIEKVAPINDANNKKRTFYRFKDNLMEFYYRYIYRYKNANSYLSVDDFYEEFVKEDLMNKYLPYKFENISKEFLIRANKAHKINPLFYDIGTYSFNDEKHKINRQFDLVTKDKNGYISYECKYKNKPISRSVIHEEEYQILNSGLSVYKLGFISKSGFDEGVEKDKYNLFTLDDFYKFE